MESPFLPPSSPSCATPLYPVSPERINRRAGPQTPCLSPRLKEDPFFSSNHRNSDVQGKVLQFNQLAESLSPKRKDNDAALRRAVLGREEAEAKMRSLEEDNAALQVQVDEGRARERRVAQRVEDMMEDVQRHKESGTRAQAVYEKEIRRARKEAFKSSSALVKLQEELKTARNRYTLMREEAAEHKRKLETKEEEAFSSQLKLVGMEGELEKLRQLLTLAQQERDALRTSLKEEEIARIAAEGLIPLPPSAEDDEFEPQNNTPDDNQVSSTMNQKNEGMSSQTSDSHVESLQEELDFERRLRQEVQETVAFMKLECQLRICSCRRAELKGTCYVYDEHIPWIPAPSNEHHHFSTHEPSHEHESLPEESVIIRPASRMENPIDFCAAKDDFAREPNSTLMAGREEDLYEASMVVTAETESSSYSPPANPATLAPPLGPMVLSESPSLLSLPIGPSNESHIISPNAIPVPQTPHQPDLSTTSKSHSAPHTIHTVAEAPEAPARTTSQMPPSSAPPETTHANRNAPGLRMVTSTTTTKVPLADADSAPKARDAATAPRYPCSPGATKTREEALQSIQRWRQGRDRARSVTTGSAAPKRSAPSNGSPVRRDISAPERRGR